MFAHWFWSLIILAAPVALYWFVIRPRLRARLADLYADKETLLARIWARVYAFRTVVVASLAAILTAAPDLLVSIAPLDFSSFLPQPWAAYTSSAATLTIALMKAFETKPGDERA